MYKCWIYENNYGVSLNIFMGGNISCQFGNFFCAKHTFPACVLNFISCSRLHPFNFYSMCMAVEVSKSEKVYITFTPSFKTSNGSFVLTKVLPSHLYRTSPCRRSKNFSSGYFIILTILDCISKSILGE